MCCAQRKWYRNILMFGFHFAVAFVGGVKNVRDTQCGFKLFTRRTAQVVFATQRLRRWCFDVELLFVAQRLVSAPQTEPSRLCVWGCGLIERIVLVLWVAGYPDCGGGRELGRDSRLETGAARQFAENGT